jgi:hypothetical protein
VTSYVVVAVAGVVDGVEDDAGRERLDPPCDLVKTAQDRARIGGSPTTGEGANASHFTPRNLSSSCRSIANEVALAGPGAPTVVRLWPADETRGKYV